MLLSRVANACFWMSRYRERSEFTARMTDVHLITLLDTSEIDGRAAWEPIIRINGEWEHFYLQDKDFDLLDALYFLVLDPANTNSIAVCLRSARENARHAREQISSEMWEQINNMYHDINHLTREQLGTSPHNVLQSLKNDSILFEGLVEQTMLHQEACHFIRLGRYIERANMTCRLLAVRAANESALSADERLYSEALHWIAVLKSASGLEAFHKTYAAPVSEDATVEFLLLHEDFPRSLLYCLEHGLTSLREITGTSDSRFGDEAERLMGQLASRLHYVRLEEIKQETHLAPFLREIQGTLYHLGVAIAETYFDYELA